MIIIINYNCNYNHDHYAMIMITTINNVLSATGDGVDSSIFSNFSAHADGERRGLDRTGGQRRKGLGAARL